MADKERGIYHQHPMEVFEIHLGDFVAIADAGEHQGDRGTVSAFYDQGVEVKLTRCTCGHERDEHEMRCGRAPLPGQVDPLGDGRWTTCGRCACTAYTPKVVRVAWWKDVQLLMDHRRSHI